jgi:hypothetical protein
MVPPGIPDWHSRRRVVDRGKFMLFGRAWSGRGVPLRKVEVAVGAEWHEARLDPPAERYTWQGWRFEWGARPGEHKLMCRATDSEAETQPFEQRYDGGGFLTTPCSGCWSRCGNQCSFD